MKTPILAFLLVSFSVFGTSTDDVTGTPAGLTDEQTKASQEFVHTGLEQRVKEQECKDKGLGKCKESDADGSGLMGVIEQNIGRAYTMVFGATGFLTGSGGPSLDRKAPKDAAAKPNPEAKGTGSTPTEVAKDGGKKDKEQVNDYCMYGAMAYEGVSLLLQTTMQDKAIKGTESIADPQLRSLVVLKETHKARRKTSAYQAGAYGAVTACYAGYLMTVASVKDWKLWAKMGGAAILTTFYGFKARKHKIAADKVDEVIKSLPKAGDCNPWTESKCFCEEQTSKATFPDQYQEVCILNNGNPDGDVGGLGCAIMIDGQASIDKECKCKLTNTCINRSLALMGPQFGLGSNFLDQNSKNFDLLNDPNFNEGRLSSLSTKATSLAGRAFASRKNVSPVTGLTGDQKALADQFGKFVPADIAATAAKSPISTPKGLMLSSSKSALSNISDANKKKLAEAMSAGYKSGGGSSGGMDDPSDEFVMPKMPGAEAPATEGPEVLTFAEKAVGNADVNNSQDTPLFDIISNRYRRSGWGKLETKTEPAPTAPKN